MADVTTPAGTTPAPKSLLARFFGVLTAPGETFRSIAAHPKWFGMLALTVAIVAFFSVLPMTTEEGKQAALDQQVSQMEAFGSQVDSAQYERMRKGMALAPYFALASIVVISPIVVLVISGILFAVFNAAMGGEASFKQLFAVVVSAGVISAVGAVFTGTLNYFRGAVGGATNLGVLLPVLDEKSFLGRLFGMADLFIVWWLIVLAIGLAVLYRGRTQPIAAALLGCYAMIALVAAAVMSRLGGGN
jgi:hypothetical protein